MQKHIARKLLVAILVSSSIVTFFLTTAQLISEYRQELRTLDSNILGITEVILPSISKTTWTMDNMLQATQVEGLIKIPFISYAAIKDENGQITQYAGDLIPELALKYYDLYHNSEEDKQFIGTLVIQPNRQPVYDNIKSRVFSIFIVQAVKTFITSLIIFYIIHHFLSRHLYAIADYINLHLGNYSSNAVLILSRKDENDELQAIVTSINKTKKELTTAYLHLRLQQKTLQDEIKLRTAAEQSLRSHTEHLITVLDHLTDAVITLDIKANITHINEQGKKFLELEKYQEYLNLATLLSFHFDKKVDNNDIGIEWQTLLQLPMPQSISGYGQIKYSKQEPLPLLIKIMKTDHEFIMAIQDQSQAYRLEEASFNATHDYLTGAYNRYGFIKQIENILAQQAKYPSLIYTLLLIDLDRFKQVNDTSGHQAGDELLRQVVKSIKHLLTHNDIVARLGGDEFAILMADNVPNSTQKSKTILYEIENLDFHWHENPLLISASIGITPLYADDTESTAIARADNACYLVKHDGGGAIQFQDRSSQTEERLQYKLDILQLVRSALEHERLLLYAQPIIMSKHIKTDATPLIQRLEILARLQSASGDIINPETFIPVMDQYAYTPKIDIEVIKKVAAILPILKKNNWNIHINLSPITLIKPTNIEYILSIFNSMELAYDQLCIEITEHAILEYTEQTLSFMRTARKQGITFALDDFGSGYASFGSLRKFNFEYIKLDKVIIQNINYDPSLLPIARSIQSMATALGAKTIAEYVASAEIKAALYEIDIDYLQGNYLSATKPLRAFIPSNNTLPI